MQVHKELCSKVRNNPKRPDEDYKLGIHLRADNPSPQLIWVLCSNTGEPLDYLYLGTPDDPTDTFTISENKIRGYQLDYTVVLYAQTYRDTDARPNQAALALTDWQLPFPWKGDLLVMRHAGTVNKNASTGFGGFIPTKRIPEGGALETGKNFVDITLSDLRTVVDYLTSYKKEEPILGSHNDLLAGFGSLGLSLPSTQKKPVKMIQGVVIRCDGERYQHTAKTGRKELYSSLAVPSDHPIWNTKVPVDATRIMGLPLLTYQLPKDPAWKLEDPTSCFDNQFATFLNLELDPDTDWEWGWAKPEWQNNVGSILIVRKDREDLTPEQVQVLAEWLRFVVAEVVQGALEKTLDSAQQRQIVLKWLNWQKFEDYLNEFKTSMMAGSSVDKQWTELQSPFEPKKTIPAELDYDEYDSWQDE